VSLEQSVTGTLSEPHKCSPHIPNYFFKIHFNIILLLMGMTYKKSLPFRIAIQISRDVSHTHYDRNQEIAKCNFTFSFWGAINGLKA
jgi:hypothetical protein